MADIPEEFISSGAESWYRTKLIEVRFCHMWKIENFNLLEGDIHSPLLESKKCNIKWQLAIVQVDDYFEIVLRLVSLDVKPFQYKWKCYILNHENEMSNISETFKYYQAPKYQYLCVERFLRSKKYNELKDGNLVLVSEITMILSIEDAPDNRITSVNESIMPKGYDFSRFLEKGKFSDVILIVDDKKFYVHKAILSLRSSIFESMFDKMIEDGHPHSIVIKSFGYKIIQEMLSFIYSNKTPNIDEMAAELLEAANAYDLVDLQKLCVSVLQRKLSTDTAVKTLILARRYNLDDLKKRSLKVIEDNISTIMDTELWTNIIKDEPQLINEIVNYMTDD